MCPSIKIKYQTQIVYPALDSTFNIKRAMLQEMMQSWSKADWFELHLIDGIYGGKDPDVGRWYTHDPMKWIPFRLMPRLYCAMKIRREFEGKERHDADAVSAYWALMRRQIVPLNFLTVSKIFQIWDINQDSQLCPGGWYTQCSASKSLVNDQCPRRCPRSTGAAPIAVKLPTGKLTHLLFDRQQFSTIGLCYISPTILIVEDVAVGTKRML
ncbi:hypothetical protein C8R43DRAFT_961334 [Mycena crocata]|nr:hypothetical protein C8R43DRAFT_961334 [Mycena crocata]